MGLSSGRITSSLKTSAPAMFSPSVRPLTVTADRSGVAQRSSSAPAGRRRSRSPPSGSPRRWAGCWRSPARVRLDRVEVVQVTARRRGGHRDQVDDGVGAAAHGHGAPMPFFEAAASAGSFRRQVVPHHLHDAAAAFGAHARGWRRPPGSNWRRAGSGRGLGDAHHRRRRAHGHAGAVAARDAASISSQAWSLSLPARRSSQYFQASLPEPSTWPRQLPRSIGPAGR
jgi:hypothetical protein